MKIIRLEAENVKRLVAVDITPEGNIVELTGPNGAGKTSILDAIWWALAGQGVVQTKPIRRGEEKARIRLDLGELIVTRRFTLQPDESYTTSVVVEKADGARYPGPQAMLDALVATLTFDPLDFKRMRPKDQFEELKRLSGVDFSKLEAANDEDYRARTAVNRRAKELLAQAQAITIPNAATVPDELQDENALVEEMVAANAHNVDVEKRKYNRERAEDRIAAIQDEIRTLTDEMHGLQTRLAQAPALPVAIDTAALAERLTRMREDNKLIAAKQQRDQLLAHAEAQERQADELTQAMAGRDAEKRKMIEEATMPVQGLGFGDGFVTLSDAPFDQASDAEQLRASVAIAGAMNPKLKVLRVRDGSLLDEDSMAMLASYAAENDLQIWVETVSSDRADAIRIENGRIKETPSKAKAKAEDQGSLL